MSGYVVGTLLRFLSGEPTLYIPTVTKYPMYDYENDLQLFPVKTFAMLINFGVTLVVSFMVNYWTRRRQRVYTVENEKELELKMQEKAKH